MDLNGGTENRERRTNQIGVNLKHSFSDAFSLDVDASYAKSEQNPSGGGFDGADIGYGGTLGFNMGVRVTGDSSDHLPEMTTYGPNGDTSRYLDPSVIGSHVLVRTLQENTDTIKQARLKLTWQQESTRSTPGCPTSTTTSRSRTATLSPTTSGRRIRVTARPRAEPRAWSCLRHVSQHHQDPRLHSWILGCWRAATGVAGVQPVRPVWIPRRTRQSAGADHSRLQLRLLRVHRYIRLALDPGSVQDINEKTWAAFVRAFRHGAGRQAVPLHRRRARKARMFPRRCGSFADSLTLSPADPTLLTTTYSATQPITTESEYSTCCPAST